MISLLFIITYLRTYYYYAFLSYLYKILFKILSKRKCILYLKLLFQHGTAESDYPAVYESADYCSCLDTFKVQKAKEQKGEGYSDSTGNTVIDSLRIIDVYVVPSSYFLYKELICFRRYVGVEEGGDSKGAEEKTEDIEEDTSPQDSSIHMRHKGHHQVQNGSIQDSCNKKRIDTFF